jgi:hypothetical protein
MRSQTTPHCRPLATLASHTTLIPRGRHLSTIILFIDPWPTGHLIYAPVPASWLDPAAALCPWSSFSSQSARAAVGGRLHTKDPEGRGGHRLANGSHPAGEFLGYEAHISVQVRDAKSRARLRSLPWVPRFRVWLLGCRLGLPGHIGETKLCHQVVLPVTVAE